MTPAVWMMTGFVILVIMFRFISNGRPAGLKGIQKELSISVVTFLILGPLSIFLATLIVKDMHDK